MIVSDFFDRVAEHPALELLLSNGTKCIIRCSGPQGQRSVRLGLWVVRRKSWEQILAGLTVVPSASRGGVGLAPRLRATAQGAERRTRTRRHVAH